MPLQFQKAAQNGTNSEIKAVLTALLINQGALEMSWDFQHDHRDSINLVTLHAKYAIYGI